MDINALLPLLLGGDNANEISRQTGASTQDVTNVLSSALPQLLEGKNEKTTARSVSKSTGIDLNTILRIFAVVAPLLQSLLGNNSNNNSNNLKPVEPQPDPQIEPQPSIDNNDNVDNSSANE